MTHYVFTWTGEDSKTLLEISAADNSPGQPLPLRNELHLGFAAEAAWSEHFLEQALGQLSSGESVKFPITDRGYVEVGRESLRVKLGGKTHQIAREDLAVLEVEQGVVILKETKAGAKRFSRDGIHSFEFSKIANAKVFLMLMERLYDITDPTGRGDHLGKSS